MTDAVPPQDDSPPPVPPLPTMSAVEPAGAAVLEGQSPLEGPASLEQQGSLERQGSLEGPRTGQPISTPELPRENASAEGRRCWYCGVAEAIGWFLGTLFVHLSAGVFVFVALIVIVAIRTGTVRTDFHDPQSMLIVTAGEMAFFVLAAMLAVSVRYWGRTFQELNFARPDLKHLAIVIGGTLPLSFCVSACSLPFHLGWQAITEQFPELKFFDSMNAMEMVKEMSETTPLLLMIVIVAALPAIGEELIFRGAIGRVLIANLGVWGGVILTSVLFGGVHLHPVHALSVIPLGVAMHVIYLWTRSFWMPMLLHFLNNSWAAVTVRIEAGDPFGEGMHPTSLEWLEIATAAVAVVALTIGLWQSRVRYIQEDGHEWKSARFPIRVPPRDTIHRQSAPINSTCWYVAVASVVVCHSIVAIDLVGSMLAAN